MLRNEKKREGKGEKKQQQSDIQREFHEHWTYYENDNNTQREYAGRITIFFL